MRNLPTILRLKPDGKIGIFCSHITRVHLIGAAIIFLGLLSTSLLIAVIVQTANRGQNNNSNKNNTEQYCLNRGCLSAATHQLRFMDNTVSVNRCTDFYNYACGDWKQTHPIQSFDTERTILGDIIDQRNADIERLLNSPISRISTQSWEWKVKTYYTECLDDYARVLNSSKVMIRLIRGRDTVDGWFLFDNSAENSSQEFLLKNQTVYQQILNIHGELGATVGFDLRVRFDDTNPNITRLERRSVYQFYILEVLALLAQDAEIRDENLGNRMYTIANDAFTMERYLAEYLQFSKDNNSSIISGTTSVYVTHPTYFHKVFSLFSNNDDPLIARLIHNYMRWRLVHTYIEDLPYNYIHAHRLFIDNYDSNALHSSNEVYCTREVIRKFPLAIQRLYTMNSTTHSDTIQTIFYALKDGFKEYINEQAIWMTDEATKTIARQKIDALTVAIGYASIATDDALLDDYYEKFVVDDKSHIENAYGYHRFHRWTILNSLAYPMQLDHWDFFETRTNRLFVIASAMNEPLVNVEWPWTMNLGSLGVLLAQKLFASIDGLDGIPDWWSLLTATAYNTSRQCIANYYINDIKTLSYNVNNEQVSVQLTGEPFSLITLRHIGALRFAYTTLKKTNQIKSWKMPGTELTNVQTFFLAYAQTQCYQRQELLQFVQTKSGIYDERIALNTALVHMPEFVKAFQCELKENTCF